MKHIFAVLACLVALTACQSQPAVPANVGGGATVAVLPADAAPKIAGIRFTHGLEIGRLRGGPYQGNDLFAGEVITSSNVASVELRTNLFSVNASKTRAGHFVFNAQVLDLPSIFIRPYNLRVIARNTRGDETEEDVPFRIQ